MERGFGSFVRAGRLFIFTIFAVIALFALPGFSPSNLQCNTTCAAETNCVCTVTPCDSGVVVATNEAKSPIGAFSVLNGQFSFYPPEKGTYNLQARCGEDLSNVLSINAGEKPPACTCGSYVNIGCGLSPCPEGQMLQKRTCSPTLCEQETFCFASSSCTVTNGTTTTIPGQNGTIGACGNKYCEASSGENYLNCCIDCQGCERSSCSSSTRVCGEAYDLVVDVPGTIYKGSQFILSPRAVIDRATNRPVDAYTLCWQAYCQGSLSEVLGCNKNVFSIGENTTCVDTLTAVLSVGSSLYQYDYSVKYLRQLKVSSAVFPSEYTLKGGETKVDFSISVTNLDSEQIDLIVKSLSEGVQIDGSSSRRSAIGGGSTERFNVTTPAIAGEYQVSIAEASGDGELLIQKLKVLGSGSAAPGAHPQIVLSRNGPYTIEPGGSAELAATVKNTGSSGGAFSVYSKGGAASAVQFSGETQFTLEGGAEKTVPFKIAPSFSAEGEYSLSICASIETGEEYCLPANIRIAQSQGGLFDFTLSEGRLEMGVDDSPKDVQLSIISRSTLTRSVKPFVENTCPAGVISASFLNATSISLESGSYSNTIKVSSIGKTVSCALTVTLSDNSGSVTKYLDISIAPSATDVTKVADLAGNAQTKILEAEGAARKISSSGKDASPAENAVIEARTALSACIAELNKRNYDTANVLCKKAVDAADGALAVARYTEEAYGLEAPTGNLNNYVIAGVVVVVAGVAILTFGRMF